jgi:hypothetical protein
MLTYLKFDSEDLIQHDFQLTGVLEMAKNYASHTVHK